MSQKFGGAKVLCPVCQKTVFKAEERIHEGETYHSRCFNQYTKKKEEERLKARTTYNHEAHGVAAPVNPGHGYGGVVALDGISLVDGAQAASPRAPNPVSPRTTPNPAVTSSGGSGGNFCGECGTKAAAPGLKFCGNCGSPFK